jgi:hypothetical protein
MGPLMSINLLICGICKIESDHFVSPLHDSGDAKLLPGGLEVKCVMQRNVEEPLEPKVYQSSFPEQICNPCLSVSMPAR